MTFVCALPEIAQPIAIQNRKSLSVNLFIAISGGSYKLAGTERPILVIDIEELRKQLDIPLYAGIWQRYG